MTSGDRSWTCPVCGYLVDTPMHELGCPEGRAVAEAERALAVVKLDSEGYEEGEVGYWHRRYDEQHRTLHRLEDELAEERRRYRELQEQTGSAIVRAHIARGNRELDAAKLTEELDAARAALREIRDAEVEHSSIPPLYDSLSCPVCKLQRIARDALGEVK